MSVVKLKEEKQKKLKVLSKIIEVVGKIAKVFCYIGLGIFALFAFLIPVLINNIDIKNDELVFNKESILKMEESVDGITIKSGESIIVKTDNPKEMKAIKDFFSTKNDKAIIIGCLEFCIACGAISMVLLIFFLKHLVKLFGSINREDTPFTIDNVEHIRKMAYLMIALIILPLIASIVTSALINTEINFSIKAFNILEILFMFILTYIFEYGYEIQQDSKGIIYGSTEKSKNK